MPIPRPRTDENKDDFMSRCMSDDNMQEEFPDDKQRVAVCYDQWRKKEKE